MAAGLPVVGVTSPGVGDIVDDGRTGYLTGEDPAEFAERMLDLARDEDLRARMSEAARAEAAGYDIRIVADELVALYEGLID